MDLMSAIDTRISCRSFADTPVEQETQIGRAHV
jgi:hypothetical protein